MWVLLQDAVRDIKQGSRWSPTNLPTVCVCMGARARACVHACVAFNYSSRRACYSRSYLLLVIFCNPSTSWGVMTVFLRSSSSVVTGMPMSDELRPCFTFMSRNGRRGDRRGPTQRGFFAGDGFGVVAVAAGTDWRASPPQVARCSGCARLQRE